MLLKYFTEFGKLSMGYQNFFSPEQSEPRSVWNEVLERVAKHTSERYGMKTTTS